MKKSILTASLLVVSSVNGFSTSSIKSVNPAQTSLNAVNDDNESNEISQRRTFLRNIAGTAFGAGVGLMSNQQPASASYTAYTQREKDWEERKASGDITFSSSRDLKRQLQEVAPMNVSKSQIFCPNGPSAAVSPLMENKCNDQMATPSVFGRYEDSTGNSVPGKANSVYIDGAGLLSADTGGFPSYGGKKK